jgi:hypothetical protein
MCTRQDKTTHNTKTNMKNLIALMALLTIVTVSSVTYAETSTTTINATVMTTRSIIGCDIFLGENVAPNFTKITPAAGDRQKCQITYANNSTSGYGIFYTDRDTMPTTNLVGSVYSNTIAALVAGPFSPFCGHDNGGTVAGNEANKHTLVPPEIPAYADCWSFTIDAKSDPNAAYQEDQVQGVPGFPSAHLAFNLGEHAVSTVAGTTLIINSGAVSAVGEFTFDFWFEAQVDVSTPADRYTNLTWLDLGNKP